MAAKAKPKVTKTTLSINLAGVEAAERRGKRVIPEGVYRARVDKAYGKKFSSGNSGVVWEFVVTDSGKGKGARFWHNNTFIDTDGNVMESSLWSLKGTLQALSPAIKIKDSLMDIPLEKLVGRTVAIEVADGEDNEGKTRSEIIDVFNESLIEADDEDDDEDEDEESEEEDDEEEDSEDDDEYDLDEDEL